MSFCRCACFGNSTIIPLYRPTTPSAPCLSCTRQFCLDQKLVQCVGAKTPENEDPDTATGQEGDVEARCFQRDSPKSHFIVVCFLIIVSTLLVLAGLKHYGFDLSATFGRSGARGVMTTPANEMISSTSQSTGSIIQAPAPIAQPPIATKQMGFPPVSQTSETLASQSIDSYSEQDKAMRLRGGGCCTGFMSGKPVIENFPLTPMPDYRVKLVLDDRPTEYEGDPFMIVKTTNRKKYDDARARRGATLSPSNEPDAAPFDVILYNPQDEITETTISNIAFKFSQHDAVWITPSSKSGLLAGVKRSELIEVGEIKEGIIKVEQVAKAAEGERMTGGNIAGDLLQWSQSRRRWLVGVILVDPHHKAIRRDARINWICAPVHKRREARGLTSAGKQNRGIGKGHRHNHQPKSQQWKKHNTLSLRRYR
ncbi:hypothetical protein JCM16303_001982 [Sporobolomyces ruberrimus]